jgi:outer membrane protein assembly factor BamB
LLNERKLGVRTVGHCTAALRFFFCKTLKRAYPIEELPYPKAPRRLPIILTREEAVRLIDSASNLFHRAMLITLYSTGMRRAELCHLKVEDIDSTRMLIHIRQGKGGKDRDVPLSPKRRRRQILCDKAGAIDPLGRSARRPRMVVEVICVVSVVRGLFLAAPSAGSTMSLHDRLFTLDVERRKKPPMMAAHRRWFVCRTIMGAALCTVSGFAQSDPAPIRPLREGPSERLSVNPGFRDWSPATVAGTTILAGNQTGRGGLFAIDMLSGKVKWTYRPAFSNGTASVSTPPAVSGDIVITPFAAAYPGAVVAVSLATGKELWRGPDPVQHAAVAVHADLAYVLAKTGHFYAMDVLTGRERWKVTFATNRAACVSRPIVRDGSIYLTGTADATPGDPEKPAGYYLFALDAGTGQERWRYRATAPYEQAGVCLSQPVVTADTIFAVGGSRLYAVQRAGGRDRWQPVEIRRPVEGQVRPVEVHGLVDAGSVLIGMTSGFLIAFEKDSGRTAWEIAGQYRDTSPAMAIAGNVLYFQGSPSVTPAPAPGGTLHALDLDSRRILWSFSRQTAEPNWPFGFVTPVDGGLWVSSYQALLKLE